MSVEPIIRVALHLDGDRRGYVIASVPHEGEGHLPTTSRTRLGTTLVVGSACRVDADGEPEAWKAWLSPLAGGNMRMGQSCDALTAGSPQKLAEALRKRADRGAWWE